MNENTKIRACVFDAYGTLFDVHSAVGRYRQSLGDKADAVSILWRTKQLEYTWLRSLMGKYTDFAQVTKDGLDYALETHGIDDEGLRDNLILAYLSLDCYDEVPGVLKTLSESGMSLAILSNGSPQMLKSAVKSSGLEDIFTAVISVNDIKVYKPDPRVYQQACDALRVTPEEVCFQSSNAWDAVGAKAFGFRVAWVNRFGQKPERLDFVPDYEMSDLTRLPSLVGP